MVVAQPPTMPAADPSHWAMAQAMLPAPAGPCRKHRHQWQRQPIARRARITGLKAMVLVLLTLLFKPASAAWAWRLGIS